MICVKQNKLSQQQFIRNNIITNMAFFCCNDNTTHTDINPQPIKFKLLKLLNVFNPIVRMLILPKKKQTYKFPRDHLLFLSYNNTNHIPVVYLPTKSPQNSLLLIYCHGSGSNLNNLYNFGTHLMVRFGISVLMYDYTGDGESKNEFHSYQSDIKVVLAWAQQQGYDLSRIIICGYSIGSYSALSVPGPMARILISPICGIIPFVEGTTLQYEGQLFDNVKNAQRIKARILIAHGVNEMIPYSHSQVLIQSLKMRNEPEHIELYRVEGFNHLSMPNFLLENVANEIVQQFLKKVKADASKRLTNKQKQDLKSELKKIAFKIVETRGNIATTKTSLSTQHSQK